MVPQKSKDRIQRAHEFRWEKDCTLHYSLTNLPLCSIMKVKSAMSVSLLPNLEIVDIFTLHYNFYRSFETS